MKKRPPAAQRNRINDRARRRSRITATIGIVSCVLFAAIILVAVITEAAHTRSHIDPVTVAPPESENDVSVIREIDSDDPLTDDSTHPGTDNAESRNQESDSEKDPPGNDDPDNAETDPQTDTGTDPEPPETVGITDAGRWLESTFLGYPVTANSSDESRRILEYLESGAPLRWALAYGDGGTVSYTKRYPELSYYYYDLEGGTELAYRADWIRYAASLSKLPFIYSVLLEIEQYSSEAYTDPYHDRYYDLDALWTYEPATMFRDGSGIIQEENAGFSLTVGEVFEYAVKYSDNIAFAWLQEHFGLSSYFDLLERLEISGGRDEPYMDFSARDCGKILYSVYRYFESGSPLSSKLKEWMADSDLSVLIASHFPKGMVPHKYGWDIDSFHDMAIIMDGRPYILVVMTDYEDGNEDRGALEYFSTITEMTKSMHASETTN